MTQIKNVFQGLENFGIELPASMQIKIKEPESTFNFYMTQYFERMGRSYKCLPEYSKIIEWLGDNQGRGLMLTGANGRGKTVILRYIIPAIYLNHAGKVITYCDAAAMNDRLDELLKKRFVAIDDLGAESQKKMNYGETRHALPELIDNAEKKGNLLIITSNLGAAQIEKAYGIRTRERIRSCCLTVPFVGDSMR